jgi:hypothetical protein
MRHSAPGLRGLESRAAVHGVANSVSDDLRAEQDAFIADENARCHTRSYTKYNLYIIDYAIIILSYLERRCHGDANMSTESSAFSSMSFLSKAMV